MSEFPTLTAMGIKDVRDIARFTVRHASSEDELKVYFHPAQEGCQPASLKFAFSLQGEKTVLGQALSELNRLLGETPPATDAKTAIVENLASLEQVMHAKMEEIRRRLASL
ncbi:DUF3461 family protein [Oceanisphaera arctica]|uniref:DUF3461 domain-containing protein n=1 Tax=Oceanisphaera arctica TaxID=641510 RepID=A0A2P5TN74_9GAMM|nr:DUF3461 family protein [Oceanisphaera arctica]PPL17004.1 hypothetical protein UN63_06670 [Oceanisphaera arctica]GHA07481.1 UPF0325 protein [Oceanisphaera arctica]